MICSVNMGTLAVNPALLRNKGFQAADLAPISMVLNAVNTLYVPSSRPWRSVAELVAAAKARPDTISYGTGGVGSPGHLCGILSDHIAGTKTVTVTYCGGGPQILACITGEHGFGFSQLGTVLPHFEARTRRALGVATKTRAAELSYQNSERVTHAMRPRARLGEVICATRLRRREVAAADQGGRDRAKLRRCFIIEFWRDGRSTE